MRRFDVWMFFFLLFMIEACVVQAMDCNPIFPAFLSGVAFGAGGVAFFKDWIQ